MPDGAQAPAAGWWIDWPGLYDAELAAFAVHGARVDVVHQSGGLLVLEVAWPHDGEEVRLRVGYSPLHPFFRPSVIAPDLGLQRHQHRLDKGLCLITQASGEWRSGQTVADFLKEQLPQVFAANAARQAGRFAAAATLEEQAPDPISTYYAYLAEDDAAIFFAANQVVPKAPFGVAHFEIASRPLVGTPLEGVLRRVEPLQGRWFAKPFTMPLSVGPATKLQGRWVRMPPPATESVDEILAAADSAIDAATVLQPQVRAKLKALGQADHTITGIVFEEELAYGPDRSGDGWLFIRSFKDPQSGRPSKHLIRGFRISDDLKVRVPVASALAAKHALVVGAGAIGAFVALELARAGMKRLTILEYDVVEPGNAVRWPLGRPAWGVRKAVALKGFIERNYPDVEVAVGPFRLGAATTNAPEAGTFENPLSMFRDVIREADVVVDVTASTESHEAVAYHCRALRTPLVIGYATEGAVGGVVARFAAGCDACYVCLQSHWNETGFPHPPADPGGTVTPVGCNQPTFTGASFDLQEVSLEVVRSAVGLMVPEAYDPGSWDVAVLALSRDEKRTPPRWETASLSRRCNGCSGA